MPRKHAGEDGTESKGLNPGPSRRSLLLGSLSTLAGAVAAQALPKRALEQTVPSPESSSALQGRIWSADYWAKKGEIKLYIYRKRMGAPQAGEKPLPILFLAHGSSVSSRPTFDLSVPGHGEYSLMDKFAEYGFDVWTMDFEGYGRSSRTQGNSNIADGAEDLKAASEVVRRETGQPAFHLFGESAGALRAGVFAMNYPERVRRLVFVSFTWTGKGSATLAKRAQMADYYRSHKVRTRDRNMIRSIFTRDKPGTSDPAVAEAMADAELKFGNTAPTGTYLDMVTKLPLVDPARVKAPLLIIHGEYDGIATVDDLCEFFKRLPTPDRQLVILPGASHAVALGVNRREFWHLMRGFLTMSSGFDAPKNNES